MDLLLANLITRRRVVLEKISGLVGTIAGDDTVVRWTPDGKALLVGRAWEVPQSVSRVDVVTGLREPFRTFGPPDLTGALAIIPIAISDDMKVYGYGTRRMHSHLFLVDGAR